MISIKHWGINARVVFLAMAPVILITFVLIFYINTTRKNDLDQELADKGQLIAASLASAMEFSVATGNIPQIQKLAKTSLSQDIVIGISVTNMEGEKIHSTGIDKTIDSSIQQFTSKITSTGLEYEELFGQEETGGKQTEQMIGTVEVFLTTTPYQTRQKNINLTSLFIAIVGLLASLALAFLIGRSVTRPVRGVIETVDALTRGQLDARMQESSGGELGKLRDGLNNMAMTIQQSQTRLKNMVNEAVADLEDKVAELESKNIELDEARNEAMLAKEAKSNFLANMSHEIRTPLNAIVGFNRQLGKTPLNSHQGDYIRAVNRAARQLQTVIDDILNFSKLESNMMEITSSEFMLRDSLEDIVRMLSQSASEKSIEMVLLVDSDIPDVVVGDPDRISQVIINLVNNAIKFTDQGSIVIHVRHKHEDKPENIHFHITDTGCGISHQAQQSIFSPFYQENTEPGKHPGGTGLGLVICKNLVEMMGGDIGFSSEQGKGSEFYFDIPLTTVADYKPRLIEETINVYLLDQHDLSRRAIRNTLVHMGINTFAVDSMNKLLDILNNRDTDNKHDVVMLSLPAGYIATNFNDDYLKPVHKSFNYRIIVMLSGDYSAAHDMIQLDNQISVMLKPPRSHSLFNTLNPEETTEHIEHKIEPQSDKRPSEATHNILVVEDNELNQQYILDLLSDYAVNTVCVDNGTRAVIACKNTHFDMILMDLHMPELDGVEATHQIRALPGEIANTPIIAVSADVFANDNNKLTDEGFTDFLLKPIDEEKLNELINAYISPLPVEKRTQTEVEHETVSGLTEDMTERLFTNLYDAYTELAHSITDKNLTKMHELAHEMLGLSSYFKIDSLADEIRLLQDAIRESDYCNASNLLNECLLQTQKIEKEWRTG